MAVGKDKKTGKWYSKFRYKDFTGKAIQKRKIGFETKKEAQAWEQGFIAQHEGKERLTFSQAYQKYLADCEVRLKKSTVVLKKKCYKQYEPLAKLLLTDITPSVIRNFQNECFLKIDEQGKMVYAKKTIHAFNAQLSIFFSWACKFCGLHSNPVAQAGVIAIKASAEKESAPKNIWKLADFERFIATVQRPDYHLIYTLLFFCGLRRGEVMGLRVKDLDLPNNVLHIRQNKTAVGMDTPKTKSSIRSIALPKQAKKVLEEYLDRLYKPAANDLLFSFRPECLTMHFVNQQRKINMKPQIRLHDLRHSHASMLIHLGFSPDVVADRLGHANAAMVLKIYGHMYPERRVEVVTAIDKAFDAEKEKKAE